ncbi:hypothetical protein [Streptomyces sp. NPDC086838]|uniref:hypothetical protein n=1 Tax=Streptomyces sp. NPDC086838 TaxID=3365762 RepID=UPI0010488DCC
MRKALRILALSAGLLPPLLLTSPAQANHEWPWNDIVTVEHNNGTKVSKPSLAGMKCKFGESATVCFKPGGDVWYVRDEQKDYRSGIAIWEDYNANGTIYRQGICRNPHGYYTWARCNKNYHEEHLIGFVSGESDVWHVQEMNEPWLYASAG